MASHIADPECHARSIRNTFIYALTLTIGVHAQKNAKRGIAYLGDTHRTDNSLLLSSKTPLSWYYNWSPYPSTNQIPQDALEFVPLIHGIDGARDPQTARAINSLPGSSRHLLSFNEPDGTKQSGGSSISPEDAARAYIDNIVPYRDGKNGRKWNISHPSTTGSAMGMDWLRRFNESCYKIDKANGCPTDFIAAHWYGAFDGLAGWLGTLNEFYNTNNSRTGNQRLRIWVTEMALPQATADATVGMMNQTLPYLDGLEYLEKYAWFGAFRTEDANTWTGDGVALFNGDGGLTKLGALYMGGETNGFKEGQKGEEGSAVIRSGARNICLVLWLCICTIVFISC